MRIRSFWFCGMGVGLIAAASAAEMQLAARLPTRLSSARVPFDRPTLPAEKREVLDAPELGQISGGLVNVRCGAGPGHDIVATLKSGAFVRATARVGQWLEIEWPQEAPAWISKGFVNSSGTVTGSNVRVRARGNLNAPILTELSKGAHVTVLGQAGEWLKIKPPAGARAYMYAKYVVLGLRSRDASTRLISQKPALPFSEDPEVAPETSTVPQNELEEDPSEAVLTLGTPQPVVEPEAANQKPEITLVYPAVPQDAWDRSFDQPARMLHGDAALPAVAFEVAVPEAVPAGSQPSHAPEVPVVPPVKAAKPQELDEGWRGGRRLAPPSDTVLPEPNDGHSGMPVPVGYPSLAARPTSAFEAGEYPDLPLQRIAAEAQAAFQRALACQGQPMAAPSPTVKEPTKPYLPFPSTGAPQTVRLSTARLSEVSASFGSKVVTVEGMLKSVVTPPVSGVEFQVQDWYLTHDQQLDLSAYSGQHVSASGTAAPCTPHKILYVTAISRR